MPTVEDLIDELSNDYDEELYQYIIDNNLRVITVPSEGVILGVTNDKDVNTVVFRMSRYYKDLDMSEFTIRIYYQNANRQSGYYDVADKTIDGDYIVFKWLISAHVAKYRGDVQFAVDLFTLDGSEIKQSFNTTIGTANVLQGMNPTTDLPSSTVSDLLAQLKADVEVYTDTYAEQVIDSLTDRTNTIVTKTEQAVTDCAGAAEEARNAANSVHNKPWPHKLQSGRYDNASLCEWLYSFTDDKTYGISIPKNSTVGCIKFGDHADLPAPTPSTKAQKGTDPYENLGGVFWFTEANGGCDPDGSPYIVEIDGDDDFSRSHADEDTVIMRNDMFIRVTENDTYTNISLRSRWAPGYVVEEAAKLGDAIRPYILHAKYPLSKDSQGRYRSTSGLPVLRYDVSHNSLITQMKTASTGYSGKTHNDDWYVKIMFLMKYGTKNSQSVYTGCCGYDWGCSPAVAETGVKRVIIPKSYNPLVGSSFMFGTHTSDNNDRQQTYNRDIFDGLVVEKVEDYDSDNKAVYFKTDSTFDTKATYRLTTVPWGCGCCDEVDGDGSPYNAKNNYDPFVIQGIEVMHGMYEILGNVILKNSDGTGWHVYINKDSRNESTGVTSNYTDLGLLYNGYDAWRYSTSTTYKDGFLINTTDYGGSQSSGICDGIYLNSNSTSNAEREWRSFVDLWSWSNSGLGCVKGNAWLGHTGWAFGSRRSYIGRCAG